MNGYTALSSKNGFKTCNGKFFSASETVEAVMNIFAALSLYTRLLWHWFDEGDFEVCSFAMAKH
eukprot:snap_masked-scaffold_29-processed-gene-1.38-mRNA-1 protein AED:1.00 eAED:1.00 QI:0/-1/0/0/-1/1/1/0/63